MIYPESSEIMTTTKTLLGISSTASDAVLEIVVDDAIAAVFDYIRRDYVPAALFGVVAKMSAQSFRANAYGTADVPMDVSSLNEGSRSVNYTERKTAVVIDAYRDRLKPYIDRKGKVPSSFDDNEV